MDRRTGRGDGLLQPGRYDDPRGRTTGPASLYPSPITVSGLSGTVVDVNVTLTGMNHTFTSDIDVLLVGPAGQKVVLMTGAGGSTDLVAVGLTFDDAAATSLTAAQVVSGTFKPTAVGGDAFNGGAPAPAAPYLTTLAGFNGAAANGVWNLFVFDDAAGDTGSIDGGLEPGYRHDPHDHVLRSHQLAEVGDCRCHHGNELDRHIGGELQRDRRAIVHGRLRDPGHGDGSRRARAPVRSP